MKVCSKCKIEKDFSEFYVNKSKKDKLTTYCKDCAKAHSKNYRDKNKQKTLEYQEEYRKSNSFKGERYVDLREGKYIYSKIRYENLYGEKEERNKGDLLVKKTRMED